MRITALLVVVPSFLLFSATVVRADEKKPNCKLTVTTTYKNRGPTVEVEDLYANTLEECKAKGNARRVNSDPENVKNIRVNVGYPPSN